GDRYARFLRRLADRRRGPDLCRQLHPIAHLPRLRGLHRLDRHLSRAGDPTSAGAFGPGQVHLPEEAHAMIEFTVWDILRNLLLATRWTILLSLVSFIRSEEHTSE